MYVCTCIQVTLGVSIVFDTCVRYYMHHLFVSITSHVLCLSVSLSLSLSLFFRHLQGAESPRRSKSQNGKPNQPSADNVYFNYSLLTNCDDERMLMFWSQLFQFRWLVYWGSLVSFFRHGVQGWGGDWGPRRRGWMLNLVASIEQHCIYNVWINTYPIFYSSVIIDTMSLLLSLFTYLHNQTLQDKSVAHYTKNFMQLDR